MVPDLITFSGYQWRIKKTAGRVDPGPNFFGPKGVRVDTEGTLHLAIVEKRSRWFCSEIILNRSLGYGEYYFVVSTASLSDNAVFGIFLWDPEAPRLYFREVDIELSRWGNRRKPNAQFAVQPYSRPGHLVRFELPEGRAELSFDWRPGQLFCRAAVSGRVVRAHRFSKGVPVPGAENVRLNLWLYRGLPPITGTKCEVVIQRFEYIPAKRRR
jgi:hypothetical protein